MSEEDKECLPVIKNKKLVGVVSRADIIDVLDTLTK